jgi:hypothetical protein
MKSEKKAWEEKNIEALEEEKNIEALEEEKESLNSSLRVRARRRRLR